MKTDPDFHPLAAKWLDGQATPAEQAILEEILSTEPAAMREFAALCRTDSLLHQSALDPLARRNSLAALLSAKPRSTAASAANRIVEFSRHRVTRWSAAAAAVLALTSWAMWPGADGNHKPALAKRPRPAPSPVIIGAAAPESADSTIFPGAENISPELRKQLERLCVRNFDVEGSLTAGVSALLYHINDQSGPPLRIEVEAEGDAPVFLRFRVLLPAWHLLQMMAVQTGTTLAEVDGVLTFRGAETPFDKENTVTRRGLIEPLRALLGGAGDDLASSSSAAARDALGADVNFGTEAGPSEAEHRIRFSGSSRDVKVLETALGAVFACPVRTKLSVAMLLLPLDVSRDLAASRVRAGQGTAAERGAYQESVRAALRTGTVPFQAVLEEPVVSNRVSRALAGAITPGGARVDSNVELRTTTLNGNVTLEVAVVTEVQEHGSDASSTQELSSKVTVPTDRSLDFGGTVIDGFEVFMLVTVSDIPESGEPVPTDAELAAIPVPGKPGMVSSPYSELPIELNVLGFKPGSSFTCPLTGKKFRIP